jgi:hypothetical protein
VARLRKKENGYSVSVVNPNGRNHLEDSGLDGRIAIIIIILLLLLLLLLNKLNGL